MKATVKIANVYNAILEETKADLVVIKEDKTYIGKLFFEQDDHEEVRETIYEAEVDGTAKEVMLKAYKLVKKAGMVARDNKSLKCMLHWQYMNGFSDEMFDSYKYQDDTELLEAWA